MREDAIDVYKRHRHDLIKSIYDGLDFENNIAYYNLALENLERQGYGNFDNTWEDLVCKAVSKSKADFEAGAELQIAPNQVWDDRGVERKIHEMSGGKPSYRNVEGGHYNDANPWDESHDPLLFRNIVTGRTTRDEMLYSFYLPSAPGEKSLAEEYAEIEKNHENHHTSKQNPFYTGILTIDKVKRYPYSGKTGKSLYEVYNEHFNNWKENPDNKEQVEEIKEKYSNEDIQDLELRKAHFEHTRVNDWESDETHSQLDPLENLTDKEKVELALEGGGDFPPEYYQKKPVKKGLGFEDYLFGLEFRDPKERYEIHKHIYEKGTDSKDAQIIKLSSGERVNIGRVKNDTSMRLQALKYHYIRDEGKHGPNMNTTVEDIDKDTKGGMDAHTQYVLKNAIMEHPEYPSLLGKTNQLLGFKDHSERIKILEEQLKSKSLSPNEEYDAEKELRDLKEEQGLEHLPAMDKSSAKKYGGPTSFKDKDSDSNNNQLSIGDFKRFLGYDPETNDVLGEHALFTNFKEPLLSEEHLKEILNSATNKAGSLAMAKPIRNAHNQIFGGSNGPKEEDILEDEKHLYRIKNGQRVGLGEAFEYAHHFLGGHGRNWANYLKNWHDTLPKNEDGFSILGRVNPDNPLMFEGNPETVGLFGHVIPEEQTKGDILKYSNPKSIISQYNHSSPVDLINGKATGRPRTLKNNTTHGMTSKFPRWSNKVANWGDGDFQNFTGVKDKRGAVGRGIDGNTVGTYFSANPLTAIGSKGRPLSNTENKARIAYRRITTLGRHHPPHKPFSKKYLKYSDYDKHPDNLAHGDSVLEYRLGQGHTAGTKGTAERSKRREAGFSDAEIERMTVLDEIINTGKKPDTTLPSGNTVVGEKLSEDELEKFKEELEYLEQKKQLKEAQTLQPNNIQVGQMQREIEKAEIADLNAITEMAKLLVPLALEKDPDAFNPDNPQKFSDNVARLFYDANRGLKILPHDYHKLTTYGYNGDYKERDKSISEGLEGLNPHHTLQKVLQHMGVEIEPDSVSSNEGVETILSALNLPNDNIHIKHIRELADKYSDRPFRVLTNAQIMSTGLPIHPRQDFSKYTEIENHHEHIDGLYDKFDEKRKERLKGMDEDERRRFMNRKSSKGGFAQSKYFKDISIIPHFLRNAVKNQFEPYGLSFHGFDENAFAKDKIKGTGEKGEIKTPIKRAKAHAHGMVVLNPDAVTETDNVVMEGSMVNKPRFMDNVPIGPANRADSSATVGAYYNGGMMNTGYGGRVPTIGFEFSGGKPVVGTQQFEQFLHTPSQEQMEDVFGKDTVNQFLSSGFEAPIITTNYYGLNVMGESRHNIGVDSSAGSISTDISTSDPSETLMVMMNPDALLKTDKTRPPPILPMHRIFTIKDFECLRGFSGGWVVTHYYDGQRMLIEKKRYKVSAHDENGDDVSLSGDDIKQLKALCERNYIVDAIKTKDEIHIFDIIEYDGTTVADMATSERLKILRGQFDSHEHVLVPGPHNTRITDEEGLDLIVTDLQKTYPQLLLRDIKSTYMKGERRHPKWFLLRKNKDISFIILDVRGKGPYTYRLGAGPVDEENLGNRGVEYEDDFYLDVGTVKSPKPFQEGDIISVSVSGVKEKKKNGRIIYDVTMSKIKGESDVESPASLETLGLLAKSHPVIQVPYDLEIDGNKLKISFNEIDDVMYKMDEVQSGTWIHSPHSALGDLKKNNYSLRLAESLRPVWSTAVALLRKGVTSKPRSMAEEKNRKQSEDNSAGIIDADAEDNVMKPKDEEKLKTMVKTLEKIVDLFDRVEKEQMFNTTGARGLGIDVGAQIESPRGPTELTAEQSMPDWDMLDRPTEDPEKEYPHMKNKKKKDKNAEQSSV